MPGRTCPLCRVLCLILSSIFDPIQSCLPHSSTLYCFSADPKQWLNLVRVAETSASLLYDEDTFDSDIVQTTTLRAHHIRIFETKWAYSAHCVESCAAREKGAHSNLPQLCLQGLDNPNNCQKICHKRSYRPHISCSRWAAHCSSGCLITHKSMWRKDRA